MLTRSTKVRLILFVIITLVGVSYVSAKYVGITKGIIGAKGCTISADFPDSGGIFSNAEVTYRGVTVGKVGKLHLIENGVRVDLHLDKCDHPKIPASAVAQVSDRSVVGEQYVNLIPPNGDGPFLAAHQVIPMNRNKLPVATQVLLANLDSLVNSVDLGKLQTTVSELGLAFNGRGLALGSLLDSSNDLLTAAEQNLPQTISLIRTSSGVLQTQLDEGPAFASFNHSLNLLSAQFKASDTDIRTLLDDSPDDLGVVRSFIQGNRTDLGIVFANLASTGTLLVRHLDGLEQILELYPALVAGGYTTAQNNVGRLGFVVDPNPNNPPDCGNVQKGREGYDGTRFRTPGDLTPAPPNTAAHCTAPVGSGTNVRGSANVPGGDPISTTGGNYAYPRVTTANTVRVGDMGNAAALLGDRSWIAILTDGLH
ncbi:MAG: ABC transporter substrate-binding protein [Pseudonocardiales bacterium]|nr:MAG: ABC transporter substrate-binding protein [Pseudonocardiales bacterium]